MPLSPLYFCMLVTGSLQFFTNLIIAYVILRYEGLRREKEYVIFLGLAIADSLDGIPSLYAATYRILVTLYGNPTAIANPFYCMTVGFFNPMWTWCDTAQGLMMLVVSIDRLLAVTIPLRYYSFTSTYAKRMVAAVYMYCLGTFGCAWIYPISELVKSNDGSNRSNTSQPYPNYMCSSPTALGTLFNDYFSNFRLAAVFGSVISYMLVMILFAKHLRKFSSQVRNDVNEKRQRRLTITLGIQCALHILLYIIPQTLYILIISFGINIISIFNASYLLQVTKTNGMINLFIYLARQKEFRFAFMKAIVNQPLPPTMALWPMDSTVPKAPSNNRVSFLPASQLIDVE